MDAVPPAGRSRLELAMKFLLNRWLTSLLILVWITVRTSACPSCTGDTPPDEDSLQSGGEALAYGISIAMLLGAPAIMTCALGIMAFQVSPNQPPGVAK